MNITTEAAGTAQKQRFVSLDLLRIFAAYWVLFHHWTVTEGFMSLMKRGYEIPQFPRLLKYVLEPGFLGVDVFFILSGIVISKSAIERSWGDFSKARFIRLFPAYFIATFIVINLAPFTMAERPPTSHLFMSLTGLQWFYGYPTIIGPAWTLFYEIRFYIVIAALIAVVGMLTSQRMKMFAIVWGVALILAPNLKIQAFDFVAISDYGVYFCFGLILGLSSKKEDFKRNLPLIIFGFMIAWVRMQARYSEKIPNLLQAEIGSVLILLAIVFIATRPKETNFIKSEKAHYWVKTFALATYPLYLLHESLGMPLIAELVHAGIPFVVAFLFTLAAVTVFSVFSATKLEPMLEKFIKHKVFNAVNEDVKTVSLP